LENFAENSVGKHCRRVQLEILLDSLVRNIAEEFSKETLPQSPFVENIAGKVQSENIA
jgi:hypothetical protein